MRTLGLIERAEIGALAEIATLNEAELAVNCIGGRRVEAGIKADGGSFGEVGAATEKLGIRGTAGTGVAGCVVCRVGCSAEMGGQQQRQQREQRRHAHSVVISRERKHTERNAQSHPNRNVCQRANLAPRADVYEAQEEGGAARSLGQKNGSRREGKGRERNGVPVCIP